MSNILFGQGKLQLGSAAINLSSAGNTIKASLLTMASATGKVALIASSTNATPIVVTTSAAHGYTTGDVVVIGGHATNTAANGTWQVGTTTSTTFQLLTLLDANNSTGNGVGGATGYAVDITTASTISDLGGNGGANANGTDVSLTGQSISAFGVYNASGVSWTGLSAVKSYAIALYDSSASNDLLAWIDGMYQVYVITTAAASATSIAVARLPVQIASGTTLVFSNGASATLTAQANIGATALAVSSLAAQVTAQSTADVVTYNSSLAITSGLPFTPGAGSGFSVTWDTGVNKIFRI